MFGVLVQIENIWVKVEDFFRSQVKVHGNRRRKKELSNY